MTLGLWAAGAGSAFAFLSPLIGWLGVAVTGSDTASTGGSGVADAIRELRLAVMPGGMIPGVKARDEAADQAIDQCFPLA